MQFHPSNGKDGYGPALFLAMFFGLGYYYLFVSG